MTHGRRLSLLAAAVATAAACANVIGVTDYKDAVEELCACTTLPDCEASLTASLEGATDAEARAWLAEYARLGCSQASCQSDAFRCFYTAPGLCIEGGAACERSDVCCGFDHDEPGEGAGCCSGTAGGGAGVCCDGCVTCAAQSDAYAKKTPFEDATVCLSSRQAWNELHACVEDGCTNECLGDLASEALCKQCMADVCDAAFVACGDGQSQ